MPTRGQPISEELRRRIQRVLDSGLTYYEFVCLITEGRVSDSNVGRAMRGDPLTARTTRAFERCCDAWERDRGLSPHVDDKPRPAPLPAGAYRPTTPRRGIPHDVGLPLIVGHLQEMEKLLREWDSPRRNHVLALVHGAYIEAAER